MTPAHYVLKRLRLIRKMKGLNQATVARRSRISQGAVSKYERGELVPDVLTFIRILKVFGYELKVKVKNDFGNK